MEDTKSKILLNRVDTNIVLLWTMLFGGLFALFAYIINRLNTRCCDDLDSTKDKRKFIGYDSRGNPFTESSTTAKTMTTSTSTKTSTMTTTTTAATTAANSNVNKRAKNKKRRELQQEFSHTWVVGTLKGHTSNIFNMSFSSNGKQLASCAEDGKRPRKVAGSVEGGVQTGRSTSTSSTTSSSSSATRATPTTTTTTTTTATTMGKAMVPGMEFPYSMPPMNNQVQLSTKRHTNGHRLQKNYMSYADVLTNTPVCNNPKGDVVYPHRINEYPFLQASIPEYNYNKNTRNLNHYQQEAKDFYFHQLFVQLMGIEQQEIEQQLQQEQLRQPLYPVKGCCGIIPHYNNQHHQHHQHHHHHHRHHHHHHNNHNNHWQCINIYHQQQIHQLSKNNDIRFDYQYSSLISNGVSPYWDEGRHPKQTYGFVETKRNEFIINDTVLEYVLRTYVHHTFYLIEAGYPYNWSFDMRIQQFVNNLHKPFILKNNSNNVVQGTINNHNIKNINNNSYNNNCNNYVNNVTNDCNKLTSTTMEQQQTRDGIRSSSFSSTSKKAFFEELLMIRQRSSSISTVGELNSQETRCSMCLKAFYLYRANGDLNRQEVCIHHPGDLIFNKQDRVKTWTCCGNRASVLGCKTETTHIWRSFKKNFSSPNIDYVRTKPSEIQPENRIYGVYGIDCEMVTTTNGLELGKVCLVNIHGHVVYDEYVMPESDVIDCNTRYSGITPFMLASATKTLRRVQQDLLGYIKAETILIGHALENDLKVLRIIHYTCIDTALLLKHPNDLPYRISLRILSKGYLKRIIQKGSHNPVEDTVAALDLVLYKLRDDGF